MATTYSFSRVTTYEQCPKRFDFRYNQKMTEAFDSIEGYLGKRVHDGVQWLYTERQAKRHHTLDEIVDIYNRGWENKPANLRITRKGDTEQVYKAIGEAMLRKFYPRFEKDTFGTTGIEYKLFYQLAGKYNFIGYIDRLAIDVEGDQSMWIIDYKTGKSVPFGFSGKDADQLRLYACGLFRKFNVDEIKLKVEYLRTGDAHVGSLKRSEMADVEAEFCQRVEATHTQYFPANPSVLCGWCGFRDICPEAK